MLKGIKLRLYPNAHQRVQLLQMFGNDRKVWNLMLGMANERYRNNPSAQFLNEYSMNYLLKRLKQEYLYLKQSDSTSFLVVTHNLNQAFQMLFKHRGGYPHFRSRHQAKQAYTGRSVCQVIAKRRMRLPKLGEIRTSKTDQLTDVKIKRYTVSFDATGRYYLALQVEVSDIKPWPKMGKQVGVDLGTSDLAITSDGQKFSKFNHRWLDQQIQTWQRKFAKRKHQAEVNVRQWNHNYKDIKMDLADYQNWQRARKAKARYQQRLANQRHDYLQKVTTQLVRDYDVICIEDLHVKSMLKNHRLARAMANASWYEFRRMLTYKCQWYGKQLVVVDPRNTSRICHDCGHLQKQFKGLSTNEWLKIRKWTCEACGRQQDRDVNAGLNILNRGLTKLARD